MTIYKGGKEVLRETVKAGSASYHDSGDVSLSAITEEGEPIYIHYDRDEAKALIRLGVCLGDAAKLSLPF